MTEELAIRDTSCRLIRILKRFEGVEEINIRTIGGFQFEAEGRLAQVNDKTALLTDVAFFTPGSAKPFHVTNLTVNLRAVTSVGQDDD